MIDPAIHAVFRWLKIREENGINLTTVKQLELDAEHSSLLLRLLKGKEPFSSIPPQRFNYPWYDLLEQGEAKESAVLIEKDTAIICRYQWTILSVESDGYLIRPGIAPFPPNLESSTWKLSETTDKTAWGSTIWSLKRYNDLYGMQNLSSSKPQCAVLQKEESQAST